MKPLGKLVSFFSPVDVFFLSLTLRVHVCVCPVSSNQGVCVMNMNSHPPCRFGRRPPPAGLRPRLKCLGVCFVSAAVQVSLYLSVR